MAFQHKFQFALGTDTGKAKDVAVDRHDVIEI